MRVFNGQFTETYLSISDHIFAAELTKVVNFSFLTTPEEQAKVERQRRERIMQQVIHNGLPEGSNVVIIER